MNPHDLSYTMQAGLPNVRVRTTANFMVPSGVFTQVLFTTIGNVLTDDWGMYDAVNERFQIVKTGHYQFGASALFAASAVASTYAIAAIRHGTRGYLATNSTYAALGFASYTGVSAMSRCLVGDWVDLLLYQFNGGAALQAQSGPDYTVAFWAAMIGSY